MGQISITGLTAKDPRVATFVVEVYADSALTNLLDVLTAPATYDTATGISSMLGIMTFTGLTAGTTYYLQSCSVVPGFGRGDFSAVYSIAAGVDSGGSSGGVSFGSGPPSGTSTDGTIYFDTSATNYTMYVYHSSAWHLVGTSAGGSGVFSSGSNSDGYWVQDPAGNIRQWGVVTVDINSGTHVVSFPVAFASATGVSVVVSTKSSADRITFVVDGSVTTTSFTIGNNGSSGYAYWEANGPGTTSGGGTILVDPTTTEGDILYRSSSAIARLGIGASGKFLKSNGTDPTWGDVPVLVGDSGSGGTAGLVPAPAAGDAAAGKVLKADGTWYVPSGGGLTDPTTTKGDVIVRGASAIARLPVGTDGYVLTARASATNGVDWEAGGSGSGVLLSGTVNPTPYSVVQSRFATYATTLAFSSSVTAGDLLIAVLGSESALSGVTLTDSQGNTWTRAAIQAGSNNIAIYWAKAATSGANTVTFASIPNSFTLMALVEISGTFTGSPVDATATAYLSASPESVSLTTTQASDLIITAVRGYHSANTYTGGSGMSLIGQLNGSDAMVIGLLAAGAAGSYSPSFNVTAGGTDNAPMVAVAFKNSGTSAGSDGNFYINTVTKTLWGPRTSGSWSVIGTLN